MFTTLNDALVACTKTEKGIVFIKNIEEDDFLSYGDLYQNACRLLAHLQRSGVQSGDELVLQCASLKALMEGYWACLLGRIVPVPLALADQGENSHKVFNVWSTLNSPWLLADTSNVLEKLAGFSEKNNLSNSFSAIAAKTLLIEKFPAESGEPEFPLVTKDDIAFIQFSSGSTGVPKGVVLTHHNLLVNIRDILASVQHTEADSFLSWKPISHDFGMIAFHLAPIVGGSTQYRIPTDAYIWSPSLWFSSVNKYRATILGSPNFGYRHFLNLYRRGNPDGFTWDLSCVKAIFNGAEPISAKLCDEFYRELAPYQLSQNAMRPGYGLAEASLIVSLCRPADLVREISISRHQVSQGQAIEIVERDHKDAVQFVDCGVPYPSTQVRVTDKNRKPVVDGVVGNIEIKGENVTSGYYANAVVTAEVFDKDGWLNTQDLGFLHEGRLFIVGRTKEMIIIGGVNYFPQDIEKAILREMGDGDLNRFIACGIKSVKAESEQLVIFVYHKKGSQDFAPLVEQIRNIVLDSLNLRVAHVVPVKRIPKTTSGKVKRFALVQAFNDGTYDAEMEALGQVREQQINSVVSTNVAEPESGSLPTAKLADVRKRICGLVAALSGVSSIDPSASFFDLGLTSLKLVILQEQIEEGFGIQLGSTSTLDNPTAESLTQNIFNTLTAKPLDTPYQAPANQVANNDAIAIIGMACRFPGETNTPEAFWQLLVDSVDPVADMPLERWQDDLQAQVSVTTRKGGFLKQVDKFDPYFFGISPIEAEALDPQQRLLLEICHEGFENAGLDIPALNGSNTGVFLGISGTEYASVAKEYGHETGPYTFTGSMFNTAVGRISYVYGLQGPCIASDTACSSSLVAVHQASRELRSFACDMAIAAAVNLMLKPDGHISFSQMNALSGQGRCRSFDEDADGYIRSEGCAAIVMKRMADAERDGDNIIAVIRGSAVNHNGRSGGLTVPSGSAQEKLVRKALQVANVNADDIDYVEAHGSGTKLGDPQEVDALNNVFGNRRRPLWLGSVKSNMGHLESAAGLAGLMKLALSLKQAVLVPNLHFSTPNTRIDWEKSPLRVVNKLINWPEHKTLRTGAISSLGINGTNVHVIVQSHSAVERPVLPVRHSAPYLFTLSSKSEASLRNTVKAFSATDLSVYPLAELCRAVNFQRSSYPARFACLVSSTEELQQKLQRYVDGNSTPSSLASPSGRFGHEPIVFLYTGQGSQYSGMGEGLYKNSQVFKAALDECDQLFSDGLGISLIDVLYGKQRDLLSRTHISQALIFSIEYALTAFWRSLGIVPDYVLGHSIGEYAAACAVGILTLPNAVAMVSLRGKVMQANNVQGKMAGILGSREQVDALLADCPGAYIAAVNTTENFTIAGTADALEKCVAAAKQARIFTEALPMQHAFHTPLMAGCAAELAQGLGSIRFNSPRVPFVSTKTGCVIDSAMDIGLSYWSEHLSSPVLFADAMQTLIQVGANYFIELGGTATLTGLAAQIIDNEKACFVPSLRQSRDAWSQISESIAQLYLQGASLNWDAFHHGRPAPLTSLPNTVYQRETYWFKKVTENTRAETKIETSSAAVKNIPAAAILPVITELALDTVVADVRQMISQVTGVAEVELADDVHLFSLGVDSLMLVQLDKRITGRYQVEITMGEFFSELNTPQAIAEYVFAKTPEDIRARYCQTITPIQFETPTTPIANASLAAIVQTQLALMQQQLALLAGQPVNATPSTIPVAATPAVAAKQPLPVVAKRRANIRDIVLEEENINTQQKTFVAQLVGELTAKTGKSKHYTEQHRDGFADWIATLNFTLTTKELIYPLVAESSKGSRFRDIDGNEYIDTAMGYGVCLFGHNPDFVADAIQQQLLKGIELGPQSAIAGEVAQLVRDLTGVERVAFANTGTEAVMVAIRLARAATGRRKIVRFITSFHGSFDGVLAEVGENGSEPMASGIPQSMVDDTIVLHYGAEDSLTQIAAHAEDIAAVLVEPVQSRNPGFHPREYLHALRELTRNHSIALVFDEMVTGFRCHPAGAQAYFDVQADLVTYGKIAGGGMPIGIVAGKKIFMDAIDGGTWRFGDTSGPGAETTFFAGTFCKHPLTMAAARAVLTRIKEEGPSLQERITRMATTLVERLNHYFESDQVPIKMKMFSSMYRFETGASQDLPRLSLEMNLFFRLMQLQGVYVWERRTCFFSTAHSDSDVDRIFAAVCYAVKRLREGGFSFRALGKIPENKISGPDNFPGVARCHPLSAEERRLYVLSNLNGGTRAYKIRGALKLSGALEFQRLENAVVTMVQRHDTLRSHYEISAQGIERVINDEVVIDLERHSIASSETLDDVLLRTEKFYPLAQVPLWHISLIQLGSAEHLLVFDFHHLIADGLSMSIIIDDLMAIYSGSDAQPVTLTYGDYVQWQTDFVASAAFAQQKNYWLDTLQPLPNPLALPSDFNRPPHNDFCGASLEFQIDSVRTGELKSIAKQQQVTPFMLLLASYAILVHKLSQQDDICIGVPFDLRGNGNFEHTIGMFAQTLILRLNTDRNIPFTQLLKHIRTQCAAAYSHPNVPLDAIIEELGVVREMSRNPIFDTMFIYETGDSRLAGVQGLQLETLPLKTQGSAFDLTLEITEERGSLRCSLIYAKRLFRAETIARWQSYFEYIIEQIIENADVTLNAINILHEQDKQRLLVEFNNSDRDYDFNCSLPHLLSAAAQQHVDNIALIADSPTGRVHLSYRELHAESDRLAHYLIEQGAGPGHCIGILLKRETSLIIALFAVLKTGAAYVPLDPEYPIARLSYMVERADVKLLVSRPGLVEGFNHNCRLVNPDDVPDTMITYQLPAINPQDLAYVIFTSGSTGNPKGVMLEHRNLVNFVLSMQEHLALSTTSVVLGLTTFSFDIFVLEVFVALIQGARLVLANEQQQQNPILLSQLIQDTSVNVAQMTPSRLQLFLSVASARPALEQLGVLLVGGEAFPTQCLAQLQQFPQLRLLNMYGPTETCVWSVIKDLTTSTQVTLGKPIANTRLYVMDQHHSLLAEGAKGELFIAGTGVARGYWQDEMRTAQSFLDDPFVAGEKMYATGDIVSWTVDGELIYHGRRDNQIKLRGYRIELQDVEAALLSYEKIETGAVVVRNLSEHNPVLIAFYKTHDLATDSDLEPELRAYLRSLLPEYMVPSILVCLPQLPLTPNGKIDRNSLPQDIHPIGLQAHLQDDEDVTEDLIIATIRSVWKKILGEKAIAQYSSFFDVGGNSFSLMLMHAGLNEHYPDIVDVTDIFSNPTIRSLRDLITQRLDKPDDLPFAEIRFPADFFDVSENASSASHMQIELDKNWTSKAVGLAARYAVDTYDVVLAMKALYLNKLLDQNRITVYAPAREIATNASTGFIAIDLDFNLLTDMESLLDAVHKQRTLTIASTTVHTGIPSPKRKHDDGVIALFRDHHSTNAQDPRSFDMVYSLQLHEAGTALRVDFNQHRLCEKKINGFLGGYVKLMKAVVEASEG
jgi:iturin family lipopeptide synthetase A